MSLITCPNCEALMNDGEGCPECDHHDGDPDCDCQHCDELYGEERN